MSQSRAVPAIDHALAPPVRAAGGVLWAFTLTTFLSALLLFSIQPMFAKMVLPVLGGSPSVWAVAMCFFQAALLAGYCYAHLVIKRLPLAIGGIAHLALCLLAFVVLPIALPAWLANRRRASLISGSSACLPQPSGCRFSRSRPTRRCCSVVLRDGPQAGRRSLFPLCRQQSRQPHRSARLPVRAGAGVRCQGALRLLDDWVTAALVAALALLLLAGPLTRSDQSATAFETERAADTSLQSANVGRSAGVGRLGARALGFADGVHDACHHRRRFGAAAVGAAAVALPADVRAGVPRQAPDPQTAAAAASI